MAVSVCLFAAPAATQDAERRDASSLAVSPVLVESTRVRTRANGEGVEAQKQIDALAEEADELLARYNTAVEQLASLREYNDRMQSFVDDQDAQVAKLRGELEQVDAVGRSVTPLMLRMIAALESFVALDVPFLIRERTERIERLRRMMVRADVTLSEKYRRIMEAYQIETEYGRTIEAYRGPLSPNGHGATVDFLRFGRIALLYLSLDGEEVGMWDAQARDWRPLDPSYRTDIRNGLRVARKQIAPDLISLPLVQPGPGGPKVGG
ncbi:MAG: DUF3450 domain-containing protein [Myxococcota bacterium]